MFGTFFRKNFKTLGFSTITSFVSFLRSDFRHIKADFDFDRELENQDVAKEFLLQIRMDELVINYEDEATGEDSENIREPV